ncbi:hypothetical protein PsorP6_016993 [Peronosclerospora sorghi]|uniref:Uncharacterized protein n=1 Tax=Peronosclerospora sorghi TaxID=230839 RepID=A0ACC0WC98_9STRA|nr:hypothetical protein PsorP6_016993 [Peronosclerospora sorghi]
MVAQKTAYENADKHHLSSITLFTEGLSPDTTEHMDDHLALVLSAGGDGKKIHSNEIRTRERQHVHTRRAGIQRAFHLEGTRNR